MEKKKGEGRDFFSRTANLFRANMTFMKIHEGVEKEVQNRLNVL